MQPPALAQSLQNVLASALTLGLARLDSQMLLLHACGQDPLSRAWLLAHDQDALTPAQTALAEQYFQRRLAGEPVAYIVGFKEFYGLRLAIDKSVLDPRGDTETLVDWALELLPTVQSANQSTNQNASPTTCQGAKVLDLGTGSGAIALALKAQRPQAIITATDASADALAVASGNAVQLHLAVNFVQANAALANWFSALGARCFDIIVSNPPYIAEGDVHLAALQHEPAMALSSGADGLDAIRSIIADAPAHLNAGGWLLLEHGFDQASAVQALLAQAGFKSVSSRADLSGQPRCTGGQLSA